jgi:hypothetical protein
VGSGRRVRACTHVHAMARHGPPPPPGAPAPPGAGAREALAPAPRSAAPGGADRRGVLPHRGREPDRGGRCARHPDRRQPGQADHPDEQPVAPWAGRPLSCRAGGAAGRQRRVHRRALFQQHRSWAWARPALRAARTPLSLRGRRRAGAARRERQRHSLLHSGLWPRQHDPGERRHVSPSHRRSAPDTGHKELALSQHLPASAGECQYGLQYVRYPHDVSWADSIVYLLLGIYATGLTRAWQLLGAKRRGFLSWFSPLNDLDEASPVASAATDAERKK